MISSQTLDAIVALGTALSDIAKHGPAFKKGLENLQVEKDSIDVAIDTLKKMRVKVDDGVKEGKHLLAAVEARGAIVTKMETEQATTAAKLAEQASDLNRSKVASDATLIKVKKATEELVADKSNFTTKYRIKSEELEEREAAVTTRERHAERISAAMSGK